MKDVQFNLAGQIAQYFIESKITIVLIFAIIIFGLVGLKFTPREENPQIVVPSVEVSVALPGALPTEVEHLLLSPLEAMLGAIKGVKHTYGNALDGMAKVIVEFEVGESESDALVRVNERMRRFVLPDGAEDPHIKAIYVDDVPVFTLTLASAVYDDYQLRQMAERVLERVRSVKGISISYIVGGQNREIRLEVLPEKMQLFGITLDELSRQIAEADVSQPMMQRVYANANSASRVDSVLRDRFDVENIAIRATNGRILYVKDIANVVDGPPSDRSHYTRLSFGQADQHFSNTYGLEMSAVTIAIAKRSGVNSVDLSRRLLERIESMNKGFLPPDVYTVISRDDGAQANQTVSTLIEHLFIAIGAVSIVLLVFLGLRAALIVACAIPLVFAIVIGMDLLFGLTLNRVTMYALILALGMLVDDAIVVIENTHRHYHSLASDSSKQVLATAAVEATHEIGKPTTLATLTVVIVFLSLFMVTGVLGLYFYPATFNIPVAMLASLLVAYTVTPWMARRWLQAGAAHGQNDSRLLAGFRWTLNLLLNNTGIRRFFYVLVLVLFVASMMQPTWQFIRPQGISGEVSPFGVPLAFLPKNDKNSFLVHIHLPETIPLETTDEVAREVEMLLQKLPWVKNYITHVGIPAVIDFNGQLKGSRGNIGPQFAEIRVNLINKTQRDKTSIEIVLAMREEIEKIVSRYPGSIIQLLEDPPGPPVRATVLAELYGPDLANLDRLAGLIAAEFKQTWDMAESWTSVPSNLTEYRFQINRDKAMLSGVSPARISEMLSRFMDGQVLAYVHPDGSREPVPVRGVIPTEERVDLMTLDGTYIENEQGKRIPLSELVKVVPTIKNKPINHKNGERVQYVGGELANSAPVYAVLDLDKRLDGKYVTQEDKLETLNLRFNPVRANTLNGYQLLWEGELRLTLDAFRDMGMALGMALAVIFLLLLGYYQSFKLPLLAMVPVPLGMIGVFPGHWLMGVTFSSVSMIGVIALSGVVVRNSLLIIDFIRDLQGQGLELEEAIEEAATLRLRPILLTTLAIVIGTWIMLGDPVFGGLAIGLISGASSSAIFTIFMLPLLYRSMFKNSGL